MIAKLCHCGKIKKYKQGFTLVEIMMVMAIIALLVSVAIVEGVKFRKQANESNCMANLKAIAGGFELYSARHAGAYAPSEQANLGFLVNDGCLYQDLIALSQIGNFRYVVGLVSAAGYDIRALAISPALADHNYQILSGGILKRTDSSVSSDANFRDF